MGVLRLFIAICHYVYSLNLLKSTKGRTGPLDMSWLEICVIWK